METLRTGKIWYLERASWSAKNWQKVSFTFPEKWLGHKLLIEAFVYNPEVKSPPGLIVTPKSAKVPKINKVELFM